MKHIHTMTLDDIEQEIAAIELTPLRQRTLYDAHRLRELRSAQRTIRGDRRWW